MKQAGPITATSIALWIAACGTVSQSDSPCPDACRSITERGCPNELDQSGCVAECERRRAPSASCKGQFEALVTCTSSARIECSSNGEALAVGCEAKSDSFEACLGASGGTGGSGAGGTAGVGGRCGPAAPPGAACDEISTGTAECDACTAINCCEQKNTCFGDNDCGGLAQCIANTCANALNLQNCVEERCTACFNRASVALYNAMAQCFGDHCGAECY